MKKILTLLVGVVVVMGLVFWLNKESQPTTHTVRLGIQTQPIMGLVKIAIEEGFFEEEGIEVDVKEFTAGKFALQALVGGSLDLVTPAEFPVTLAITNGEKLSIVTKIYEMTDGFPMILKKDSDDLDIQKYFIKKRRIATLVGGGPEYFTAKFFKKNNIQTSQYEIVNMKPEDIPIALSNGSVDGVAVFEPFAHFAIEKTGVNKVAVIKDAELYSETLVLVGKTDWLYQNKTVVEKFLRALKKSEKFIENNPEPSLNIISSFTKLDLATLRDLWPSFIFRLGLDDKLISTMEKEAKWAKETGKIKQDKEIPDFRDYIYDAPLKKVAPSVVEI